MFRLFVFGYIEQNIIPGLRSVAENIVNKTTGWTHSYGAASSCGNFAFIVGGIGCPACVSYYDVITRRWTETTFSTDIIRQLFVFRNQFL